MKKIENEITDSKVKVEQIKTETDINEINKEAETINEIEFLIYDKKYKIKELIFLIEKQDKTYFEKELVKKFKLLMQNYCDGIMYSVLRNCCGRKNTIRELKNKLKEKETYKMIDIRCSRNNIRFNKDTIDTVISFAEKYLKV